MKILSRQQHEQRCCKQRHQCGADDTAGGKIFIGSVLCGQQRRRTARRHSRENQGYAAEQRIKVQQLHDSKRHQRQENEPHRREIENRRFQHGFPADTHHHAADDHHGQRRGNAADLPDGRIQEGRERDVQDPPRKPQVNGDDAGVQQNVLHLRPEVRLREDGKPRGPHHDPVGDNEDGGIEQSLIPENALHQRHAQKAGIVHQGGILQDLPLLLREHVVNELSQHKGQEGNAGGHHKGHGGLLQNLRCQNPVKGIKDHAGQADLQHQAGQLLLHAIRDDTFFLRINPGKNVDKKH